MSIPEIWERIGIAESALKNAGTEATFNAVFDVLKEVARELEVKEKPSSEAPSPTIAMVPETGPRKIRKE